MDHRFYSKPSENLPGFYQYLMKLVSQKMGSEVILMYFINMITGE